MTSNFFVSPSVEPDDMNTQKHEQSINLHMILQSVYK